MSKRTNKKLGRLLICLAAVSTIIIVLEGIFYYDAESYPNALFRVMLIIQNSIKAFTFKPDIGLKDAAEVVYEKQGGLEVFVAYTYALAMFTAPYCTLTAAYKLVEKALRIRRFSIFSGNRRNIIIFGYNKEVEALLNNSGAKDSQGRKYRIHIVSSEVSDSEERKLMKKGILVHHVNCLKLPEEHLSYFFKQMEASRTKDIILFEESSAANFSLYHMLHEGGAESSFPEDVKIFCRCEDDGVRRIIEDFYDSELKEVKADPKKEREMCFKDLEIVSLPELRIQKMLKENPLYGYYENKKNTNPMDWHLHLLIVGFGKLGQQLLLQSMNQGVVSSRNRILIDVIDNKADEKFSIFANTFAEEFVEIGNGEYVIAPEKADGELRIRFHKLDIRYKQFYKLLQQMGAPERDGLYTYVAVCLKDMDISLHCMSEIERYLRRYPEDLCEKNVKLGIRMEYDRQMAGYLNANSKTYRNVFSIEENENTLALEDLLQDRLDLDAKEYNRIYNTISIRSKNASEEKEGANVYWRKLELFRRDSNRALAQHASVKNAVWKYTKAQQNETQPVIPDNMLNYKNGSWLYEGTGKEFTERLNNNRECRHLKEMAMMEHRRWCYFMASRGWKYTKNKKTDVERENPCLCTWKTLTETRPDMCVYDLMPLLMLEQEKASETEREKKER